MSCKLLLLLLPLCRPSVIRWCHLDISRLLHLFWNTFRDGNLSLKSAFSKLWRESCASFFLKFPSERKNAFHGHFGVSHLLKISVCFQMGVIWSFELPSLSCSVPRTVICNTHNCNRHLSSCLSGVLLFQQNCLLLNWASWLMSFASPFLCWVMFKRTWRLFERDLCDVQERQCFSSSPFKEYTASARFLERSFWEINMFCRCCSRMSFTTVLDFCKLLGSFFTTASLRDNVRAFFKGVDFPLVSRTNSQEHFHQNH